MKGIMNNNDHLFRCILIVGVCAALIVTAFSEEGFHCYQGTRIDAWYRDSEDTGSCDPEGCTGECDAWFVIGDLEMCDGTDNQDELSCETCEEVHTPGGRELGQFDGECFVGLGEECECTADSESVPISTSPYPTIDVYTGHDCERCPERIHNQ
jgi:hypothetical protein